MSKNRSVIIYSGGMDSFTLLNILHERGDLVHALSFNYGQRHCTELEYAREVTDHLKIPHKVIDLSALATVVEGASALTGGGDVPEGHYAEDNMKATVVPNRNMVMLSIAVAYAVAHGMERVYTAVHAGDHDIYPDCRAEFIEKMSAVTRIANYQEVSIEAPFIDDTKGTILERGAREGGLVDVDYAHAWTCYNGGVKACGKCGACVERLEAFHQMGWHDPLEYEDREFYLTTLGLEA